MTFSMMANNYIHAVLGKNIFLSVQLILNIQINSVVFTHSDQ